MSDIIKVKDYFSSLIPTTNKIIKDAVKEAAEITLQQIKIDTRKGANVGGSSFAKYSKNYKKRGTVNLKDTGSMLKNLKARRRGNSYIVGFTSAEEIKKAVAHQKGTKKMPQRKFIGISSRADKNIKRMIRSKLKKI